MSADTHLQVSAATRPSRSLGLDAHTHAPKTARQRQRRCPADDGWSACHNNDKHAQQPTVCRPQRMRSRRSLRHACSFVLECVLRNALLSSISKCVRTSTDLQPFLQSTGTLLSIDKQVFLDVEVVCFRQNRTNQVSESSNSTTSALRHYVTTTTTNEHKHTRSTRRTRLLLCRQRNRA